MKTSAKEPVTTPKPPAGPMEVRIARANIRRAKFHLVGTAPLVCNKFSKKAQDAILEKHKQGSTAKKGGKREAKNVEQLYEGSMHRATDGWYGVHAGAFRNALISACRLVNFKMTLAKLSLFVMAQGFDETDGTPLVRISGKPEPHVAPARNQSGVIDMRVRAMFREWALDLVVEFDADQFTINDVANLLERVGRQVGIGEGRHDSRESNGCGWGTFRIGEPEEAT